MPEHTVEPRNTLVIVTHPEPAGSPVTAALAAAVATLPNVKVRDLTSLYPDHSIDVPAEQATLATVQDIVLQYPTDWYSVPGLMKRWLQEVLTDGGVISTGRAGALAGKTLRVMTSTGSVSDAYDTDQFHSWPYEDILLPLRTTAERLGMTWGQPLVVHGVREVSAARLVDLTDQYRALLEPWASELTSPR